MKHMYFKNMIIIIQNDGKYSMDRNRKLWIKNKTKTKRQKQHKQVTISSRF